MSYLYIFLQSNLLEFPFYLWLLPDLRRELGVARTLWAVTLLNSITHPFVFFFLMDLPLSYLETVLWAETFAVAGEALLLVLLLRVRFRRALLASLVANLISWQAAPVLTYLIFG